MFRRLTLSFLICAAWGNSISAQTTSNSLEAMLQQVPYIDDTALLINALIETFELEVDSASYRFDSTIDAFRKVTIYGSHEELILIEYNSHDGPMVLHPYKHQFIFDTTGNPISLLDADSYRFIVMNENEPPHLLAQFSTAKGNGHHELYRISRGNLLNVFSGFTSYFPKTYDAHDDFSLNQPHELQLSMKDDNGDKRNDLAFSGEIVRPGESDISVRFVFLATSVGNIERFVQKENYSKQYAHLLPYFTPPFIRKHQQWFSFHGFDDLLFNEAAKTVKLDLIWKPNGLSQDVQNLYRPFYIDSPKRDYFIDLDSYSRVITWEQGKRVTEGSAVDSKVQLVRTKGKQVASPVFCGSECYLEAAWWANDTTLEVVGFSTNESQEYLPTKWVFDINNHLLRIYYAFKAINGSPKDYNRKVRLKDVVFKY